MVSQAKAIEAMDKVTDIIANSDGLLKVFDQSPELSELSSAMIGLYETDEMLDLQLLLAVENSPYGVDDELRQEIMIGIYKALTTDYENGLSRIADEIHYIQTDMEENLKDKFTEKNKQLFQMTIYSILKLSESETYKNYQNAFKNLIDKPQSKEITEKLEKLSKKFI